MDAVIVIEVKTGNAIIAHPDEVYVHGTGLLYVRRTVDFEGRAVTVEEVDVVLLEVFTDDYTIDA